MDMIQVQITKHGNFNITNKGFTQLEGTYYTLPELLAKGLESEATYWVSKEEFDGAQRLVLSETILDPVDYAPTAIYKQGSVELRLCENGLKWYFNETPEVIYYKKLDYGHDASIQSI
jgi:hypothetical protein